MENNTEKNTIIGITCNILAIFIFGFIFGSIGYYFFNKNYKANIDDAGKRIKAMYGKIWSVFMIVQSLSFASSRTTNEMGYSFLISLVTGLIIAFITGIIFFIKDNKLDKSNQEQKDYKCSNCGKEVKESEQKCPHCGAIFEEEKQMHNEKKDNKEIFICDNCGAKVKENAKKCKKCGLSFIEDEKEETYVCSNCGTIVSENSDKCSNCGLLFEEDEKEETNIIKNNRDKNMSSIDKKYSDLTKLKKLLDKKIITKSEFEKEKKKILKD